MILLQVGAAQYFIGRCPFCGEGARVKLSHPVIVVPGITASYLDDLYTIPPENIWAVLKADYERAAFHPDDIDEKAGDSRRIFEAREPARVVAGQPFEVVYKDLVQELRFNLSGRQDQPVPVFTFGYDWRQPLEAVENELAEFVEEVIGRTKLLRHYHRQGYGAAPKVNLVGHSMGGLVIAGYLARFGDRLRVNRVASLGTPFQGSFEAPIKVATGTADLGTSAPSSREREAARVTPALYYLVPSFRDGLNIEDESLPKSLFDPGLWQSSISETIAEFIRINGRESLNIGERRAQARRILAAMLDAAKAHRRRVDNLDLAGAGLQATDWLCVIGAGSETRVKLHIVKRGNEAQFDLRSRDRCDEWRKPDQRARRMTGDGTVPFEGAIPKFLPYESLVCVTPDDFGYWEVRDRVLAGTAGFHGILPNMNMLHRLIVRFFLDLPDSRGNTWGRPPPGLTVPWQPPLPLAHKSS